jgi:hypothetical protein
MTARQFNAALIKLGFANEIRPGVWSKGQVEFARKLELGERSVRRWAAGHWPVPTPIAMLLNLMLDTESKEQNLRS